MDDFVVQSESLTEASRRGVAMREWYDQNQGTGKLLIGLAILIGFCLGSPVILLPIVFIGGHFYGLIGGPKWQPTEVRLTPTRLEVDGERHSLERIERVTWEPERFTLVFHHGERIQHPVRASAEERTLFAEIVNEQLRSRGTTDDVPDAIRSLHDTAAKRQ